MKRSNVCLSVALLATVLVPKILWAQVGSAIDYEIHQDFVTPRALGMGNAFVAVADDYSAVLYNPGALALLTESDVSLNLGFALDPKYPQLLKDIQSASSNSTNSIQQMVQLLESSFGKHYSSRLPMISGIWSRPNWGLAISPVDLSIDTAVHQIGGAALNLTAYQDTTIAMGWARKYKLFGQALGVGVTPKLIHRVYFNKAISAVDLAFDSNLLKPEDAKEGLALDFDLGFKWEAKDWSWLGVSPTFGLVVRNVADYGYIKNFNIVDKNSAYPNKLGRRFDLGMALQLPDWWVFTSRFAFDIRDLGHRNWTLVKGSHLGLEFLWKLKSWFQGGWRVGLSQGYPSGGFTGRLGIFQLDLLTYAKEVGTSDARNSTRLYQVNLSMAW